MNTAHTTDPVFGLPLCSCCGAYLVRVGNAPLYCPRCDSGKARDTLAMLRGEIAPKEVLRRLKAK